MQFVNNMNKMVVVSRQKLNGLGEHWGVLFQNGMVVHNSDGQDITIVPLNVFASGKNVKVIREVDQSQWTATNWRLHQELNNPKKYHLLDNNCETFANRITGHVPESSQVKGAAFFSAIMLLVMALK